MKSYMSVLLFGCLLIACSGGKQKEELLSSLISTVPTSPGLSNKPSALDGPFGFVMGESIKGLNLDQTTRLGFYQTSSSPKPNGDFSTVQIEAYPKSGICSIEGVGITKADSDGSVGRQAVDDLSGIVQTKYGSGAKASTYSVENYSPLWSEGIASVREYYNYTWQVQNAKISYKPYRCIHCIIALYEHKHWNILCFRP